jgi:2,3-bisphosphoglycerate-independent phosphoglycerate mutase
MTYINQLKEVIKQEGVGQIASIMGRYWAMDRDLRWDRTKKAYNALTKGAAQKVLSSEEVISASYKQGKTDEFIEPSLLADNSGNPRALVQDNDAVVFFNFRIDRPRQLSKAFLSKDFQKSALEWDFDPYAVKYEATHTPHKEEESPQVFERGPALNNLFFVMMTDYGQVLIDEGAKVAFPPEKVDLPLGRVVAEQNLRQLRVAESEKERFVTYYFNGLHEQRYEGEERIIIPSPKVPTYDQKPEMSAKEITDALIEKVRGEQYPFSLINYANPDMVGHTGNIGPSVKACEVVDECVGRLANHALAYGGTLLITADHGNVEELINLHTGQIDTEHSINPVPFIAVSKAYLGNPQMLHSGILADIAPTVLGLLGINIPDTMTGRNLLVGL